MQMFEWCRRCWLAVSLALFALAMASPVWASDTVYAKAEVVVYSSPTTAAPEVTRLSRGASVLSHGAEGEWLNVDVDVAGESVNGWIHEDEVEASPSS